LFASRSFIREHDADKSGQVSCAEAPPDFEEAFVHWDADQDGQLSRAEVRRHARLARRPSAEPVETVYAWMMQADSGRMKKESLQQAYDQLQRLDQNADGAIDESALASKPEPGATDRRTASRGLFGRRR
jgi:Ca2+-binding EF-hand superfamily protein